MPRQLDIRSGARLPRSLIAEFNELAMDQRIAFSAFCNNAGESVTPSDLWLLSSPATRNPLASPLFLRFLWIELICDSGSLIDVQTIQTDSPAVAKVLAARLAALGRSNVSIQCQPPNSTLRGRYKTAISPLAWHLRLHARLSSIKRDLPREDLVLAQSFISPETLERDHYFGDAFAKLPQELRENVRFVPCIYGVGPGQVKAFCSQLQSLSRPLVFKESFLKVGDYFTAWKNMLASRKLRIPPQIHRGVDYAPLIREELGSLASARPCFEANLNRAFARRLKEQGIRITKLVNWYENQQIDRGWNLGFQEHHPRTPRLGYAGYPVMPLYMPPSPVRAESDYGVLPHVVGTGSTGLSEDMQRYTSTPTVQLPIFRSSHLYDPLTKTATTPPTVLLALPGAMPHAKELLNTVLEARQRLDRDINWIIRPHPTFDDVKVKRVFQDRNAGDMEINRSELSALLGSTSVLVTSFSSLAMEAMARAVPTIEVQSSHGLNLSGIAEDVPSALWSRCVDASRLADSLVQALDAAAGKNELDEMALRVLQHHFNPPSDAGARLLFQPDMP